jgi:hypothetical protein
MGATEEGSMKPEILIDGVPAAEIARRAISQGYWRRPKAETHHTVTTSERAQIARETDRAFLNMLKERRLARIAAKSKSENITRPDHPGLMP